MKIIADNVPNWSFFAIKIPLRSTLKVKKFRLHTSRQINKSIQESLNRLPFLDPAFNSKSCQEQLGAFTVALVFGLSTVVFDLKNVKTAVTVKWVCKIK